MQSLCCNSTCKMRYRALASHHNIIIATYINTCWFVCEWQEVWINMCTTVLITPYMTNNNCSHLTNACQTVLNKSCCIVWPIHCSNCNSCFNLSPSYAQTTSDEIMSGMYPLQTATHGKHGMVQVGSLSVSPIQVLNLNWSCSNHQMSNYFSFLFITLSLGSK